jgi:hypothetical protein
MLLLQKTPQLTVVKVPGLGRLKMLMMRSSGLSLQCHWVTASEADRRRICYPKHWPLSGTAGESRPGTQGGPLGEERRTRSPSHHEMVPVPGELESEERLPSA